MKRSLLKKTALAVRERLDMFLGSQAESLCFEAFFRSAAGLYMAENSFISQADLFCLSELLPHIFPSFGRNEERVREASVQGAAVLSELPSEVWRSGVQIVGQLYQYFISGERDSVSQGMKKNSKVSAECLPAATQIFTPDWIARYLTENTLGRVFAGSCGYDTSGLSYYVERDITVRRRSPEEITILDPCVGSGNILVCAFDMFMELYRSLGYDGSTAARTILASNLYGLDIDSRVCRIARFSLIIKAAEQDRELLFGGISPRVYDMSEPGLAEQLRGSDVFGSLIRPENADSQLHGKANEVCELLSRIYSCVVTNPPYLSSARMNKELLAFLKKEYSGFSADLFAAFIVRCCQLTEKDGYTGFLTPYVWMFIKSYEKLRRMMFTEKTPETLVQLEYSAFGEATVPVCGFTLRNTHTDAKGVYFRLTDFKGGLEVQRERFLEAVRNRNCGYVYETAAADFGKLPEAPAAYWVSGRVRELYEKYPSLGSISAPRKGNSTSDNDRFLRFWYEVGFNRINTDCTAIDRAETLEKRWFPYNKGGGFRKWYGFNEYIIDWYDDGAEIRAIPTAVIANYQYFMHDGLTWSTLTSGKFSIRQFGSGYIFDNGGCCIFELGDRKNFICGLLNSKVFAYIFGQLNPTLNFQSGEVAKFPVICETSAETDRLVEECVEISKAEYDSFETSRDFRRHPLI